MSEQLVYVIEVLLVLPAQCRRIATPAIQEHGIGSLSPHAKMVVGSAATIVKSLDLGDVPGKHNAVLTLRGVHSVLRTCEALP